jgi:hypothetical protein
MPETIPELSNNSAFLASLPSSAHPIPKEYPEVVEAINLWSCLKIDGHQPTDANTPSKKAFDVNTKTPVQIPNRQFSMKHHVQTVV